MSTHDPYDDDRRDDYEDEGPQDDADRARRRVEAARQRVRTPATIMQVFAAIMIAWNVMSGALSLVAPQVLINWEYDFIENMTKNNPQAQKPQMPPREEAIKNQQVQGTIQAAIMLAAGVFIFIGGAKMKALTGYGWAIAGSVLSIFPGLCCCCTGLLPGIWAFVVLLNADVKRAFQINSRPVLDG
jgi:hypothetical protein